MEPFATLIAHGVKTIETRSWKTNLRGDLYIHAGVTKYDYKNKGKEFIELAKKYEYNPGHILCKCNLVDCVLMTEEYIEYIKTNQFINYICGSFEVGKYAWILEDVEVIKPIPIKGKLGLWNVSIDDIKINF